MEEIAKELAEMKAEDQRVRWAWNEVRLEETVEAETLEMVREEWHQVDARNCERLKDLFAEYSYLDIDRFGKEASNDFWLMVQHCDQDPDFQMEVLAAMEPFLKTKTADRGNYAYLYDRVHVNTGQLQRYGTQLQASPDGNSHQPKPLETPERVDERRAEMGLPPLADYLKQMQAMFPLK